MGPTDASTTGHTTSKQTSHPYDPTPKTAYLCPFRVHGDKQKSKKCQLTLITSTFNLLNWEEVPETSTVTRNVSTQSCPSSSTNSPSYLGPLPHPKPSYCHSRCGCWFVHWPSDLITTWSSSKINYDPYYKHRLCWIPTLKWTKIKNELTPAGNQSPEHEDSLTKCEGNPYDTWKPFTVFCLFLKEYTGFFFHTRSDKDGSSPRAFR